MLPRIIISINNFILFCLSLFYIISGRQSLFGVNSNLNKQNRIIVLMSITVILLLMHLASFQFFSVIMSLIDKEIYVIIHWIIVLSESAIALTLIVIFYKN